MKLLTKEILEKATKQYEKGSDFTQMVVAKFFDPAGSWTWYLMNIDPNDHDYAWGIVRGFEVEMGSFSLSELQAIRKPLRLNGVKVGEVGIERDLWFKPMTAQELWDKLNRGEHV